MIKRTLKASEKAYLVRFTEDEDKTLQRKAEQTGLTVAGVLRAGVGMPPMDRGGARKGAGRPSKKGLS